MYVCMYVCMYNVLCIFAPIHNAPYIMPYILYGDALYILPYIKRPVHDAVHVAGL